MPAARALLALAAPVNIEHPLLAKQLIAAGILLFGDGPLGWRLFSTVAGTTTVLGVFAILQLLFGHVRTSLVGALLALFNFTLFVQARIAMLDVFEVAFLVWGVAALLWSMDAPKQRVLPRWLLGAVLFGLALGAKWAAAPFLAFAGATLVLVRFADARRAGRPLLDTLRIADGPLWTGLSLPVGLATLLGVAGAIYLLTFWPAFLYAESPLTLTSLLPFQARMYAQQTQILSPHPYQSPWWSWPLDLRPIWYLYEPVNGPYRGVLMAGNPVVWWGGLVAAGLCVWRWWRGAASRTLVPAGLWLAAFLPFAIIPKSLGFLYYYYPASVFLAGVIATALAPAPGRTGLWHWDVKLLAAAAAVFLYYYPILAAVALPGGGAFENWLLLPSWR